ncbi:MAG: nucleotidyltransferase family protein [Betaproteobacteria bacterium]|nr:nucleotidyltransferase family protein [Betaproteobacteria bacterium]MBI2959402.1 nucleotidyltransferase family protein [Betaproteobacteria bacterium]
MGSTTRHACGILLAAGSSTRFGSNKLLHKLPDGTPIAAAAARNLRSALPRTIAVVRPGARRLAQLLREAGCAVVTSRNAANGMGASLASGVRASSDADGWVVALADMPFIRPASIKAVAARLAQGAAIAAPSLAGRRGHPVGLARRFRGDLLGLRGDQGARALLERHSEQIRLIESDDPGVLRDIDTPDDLRGIPPSAPRRAAKARSGQDVRRRKPTASRKRR